MARATMGCACRLLVAYLSFTAFESHSVVTMLQQLRKASKSWVASAIIGVLVLAFALWGVADIFRGGGDTVVADVGTAQISSADYQRALQNQMRAFSAQ